MPLSAREKTVWGLVLLLVIAALFVPTLAVHEKHPPKEESKYIRRVWGAHTAGQRWRHEYAIDAVSFLVRGYTDQTVDVILEDEQARPLASERVSLKTNDQWRRFTLTSPLPPGEHAVRLRAPALGSAEDALLVRFQADSGLYEPGEMVVDETPSYGDLAFETYERVPLWRAVQIWGQITDKAARRGSARILWAAGLALVVWVGGKWLRRMPNGRWRLGIPLVLLFLLAWAVRAPYATAIEGVFGGDAFNYLSKAADLAAGGDPFASDPRKAPFFSFLLVPGLFMPDPLLWSRWVGITGAASAVGLLPLVARRLGVPWPWALASGVFLAVNQEFIWEAPSGLNNTVYTGLIVAAVLSWLHSAQRRSLLALAIFGGLVPLTRYEGILMSAILLPAAWLRQRVDARRIVLTAIIAAGLAAMPLSSYFITGVSGVRTLEDIRSDAGLQLVLSPDDLHQNLQYGADFIRDSWVVEATNNMPVLYVWLSGIAAGCILWGWKWRTRPRGQRWGQLACLILLLGVVGVLILTKSSPAHAAMAGLPIFISGVGMVELLRRKPIEASALAFALLLHTAAIILILPKPRYFLPLLPFFAIALAAGLASLAQWPRAHHRSLLAMLVVMLLAVFFYHDGSLSLQARLEWYNGKAQDSAVMIAASKFIRGQEVRAGFINKGEQPILIYVPAARRFMFSAIGDTPKLDQEETYIRDSGLQLLVERNREPTWEIVRVYPERFELVQTFASPHGESKVLVYRVK